MNILFCGGGALGSHALLLARDLNAELAVVDFDRVETRNLNAQWFVKTMVGKNKATALKLQLLNFYGRKVNDFPVRLSKDNLDAVPAGYDLLVDGFDNAASRRLVQDYARRHNKPCLHAGLAAEGAYGIVRWDRNFIIDEEDAPGQPTCEGTGFLPIIVRVSSALIRSIQVFLDEGRELNWNIGPENAESF